MPIVPCVLALAANGSAVATSLLSGTGGANTRDFVEGLSLFVERAVLILASILIVMAILVLAVAMWKRMRLASLVVRPFVDSAVDVKVGPGIASLVEERLMGALRRKGGEDDTYDLDHVAIDIELLAEHNDLSKAITQLVDVPQLKLVGALMGLVERMLPSRGLAVTGELLPAGSEGIGVGVALALYKGSRLAARSSLWESEVKLWLPGATPDGEGVKKPKGMKNSKKAAAKERDDRDPSPHYGLAAAAAWWVQYEAAQVFDANVSLVTKSAPSFSLVGVALAQERKGEPDETADSYARALALDPDNVAALFNLALLLGRRHRLHAPAALLLVRAEKALRDRHRSQKRSASQSELRDPTWYRIRYALAVQCLQLAASRKEGRDGKAGRKAKKGNGGWDVGIGWPPGLKPGSEKNARWKGGDFSAALRRLLVALAEDGNTLPPELAARMAGELLVQTGEVLNKDGWRWVGRPAPRFRRGAEWLQVKLDNRIPLKWRERPVASDQKLTQFLNEVVEPAAVVLYCATIATEDGEYERLRVAIREPASTGVTRLDRRSLSRKTKAEWARAYLGAVLVEPPAPDGSSAALAARLRRRRWRKARAQVSLDPRANYSFACLLSRLVSEAPVEADRAGFAAMAAKQLESALARSPSRRRGRLAEWARDDPDLDGLRDHDRVTFDAIVATWGPAERRSLQHVSVASPTISTIAYQSEAKVLELQLKDGSRRQFLGFPGDLFEELEADPDPDRFVAEKVEPNFTSVRA